jgi:hypothetical protein
MCTSKLVFKFYVTLHAEEPIKVFKLMKAIRLHSFTGFFNLKHFMYFIIKINKSLFVFSIITET